MRITTLGIAARVAVVAVAVAAASGDDRALPDSPPGFVEDVKVRLEAAKPEFTQLEPIKLVVVPTNKSDRHYGHTADVPRHALFRFRVTRRNNPVPQTSYHEELRVTFLATGREWVALDPHHPPPRIDLYPNLLYDMTIPDEYEITVGFPLKFMPNFPKSRDTKEGIVWSNPVRIKVRPLIRPEIF